MGGCAKRATGPGGSRERGGRGHGQQGAAAGDAPPRSGEWRQGGGGLQQQRGPPVSPAEPTAPALCRVALLVGEDFEIDYSLPAGVALIAVTEDLVARVNEVLAERGRTPLDAEQSYPLCRADAQPLDPQQPLHHAGVPDREQP